VEGVKQLALKTGRHYEIEGVGRFPSVTNILGKTSDKSFLIEWKKRIGEKEAKRISTYSASRGTVMHKLLELHLLNPEVIVDDAWVDLQLQSMKYKEDAKEGGRALFNKFMNYTDSYTGRIKESLANEVFLWSEKGGGYAGTVDNVSIMHDGSVKIIDFKSSNKPKRDAWINDYFLQVSAYAIAYWERYNIAPTGGEIWIANEIDEEPQNFTMTLNDIKHYFKEFKERLNQYYKTV